MMNKKLSAKELAIAMLVIEAISLFSFTIVLLSCWITLPTGIYVLIKGVKENNISTIALGFMVLFLPALFIFAFAGGVTTAFKLM